ncbi:hypothetical protein [Hymenobacter metallicola]|uniref:Uncharacterized protein n=1 Tax=Hymenobacter metallicola TaxID=2563114 RepID=A0A4Z0Q379_9BACT|nr:hypothetical protein [Hymenobacter metallicola]TGE23551.1 hypothetical protein E5K02_20410 [Hymenobacter metallicola]
MPPKKTPKTPAETGKSDFRSTFEANPEAQEIYTTSDGQAFLKEGPAKSHAKFLGDNTVSKVTRDEADAEPEEEATPAQ